MTETAGLGRIEKAGLREAWPHEAADLTPWLGDHVSELGAALGLELELQSSEAPVGTLSLDLLARDTGTNRTVIIENQLEPTDHDHLGKLLTYAGGYDANVIVWVARNFRDEHRQALDWLNQHTDDDTEFFGVVVEVWKIDGSRPAPHFNMVAAPNEWRREAVESSGPLLLQHFQTVPPPDPLYPILAHWPSRTPQQCRDLTIPLPPYCTARAITASSRAIAWYRCVPLDCPSSQPACRCDRPHAPRARPIASTAHFPSPTPLGASPAPASTRCIPSVSGHRSGCGFQVPCRLAGPSSRLQSALQSAAVPLRSAPVCTS